MTSITKAIIPVAGWGTRRLPITKAIEKCMLPVGNRPIVDYVVQDCIAAGIKEIYFVVNEQSDQIRRYYGTNEALDAYLERNGKTDLIPQTLPDDVTVQFIVQPDGAYGTAVPVALALDSINKEESVLVVMGDGFIFNTDHSSEMTRLLAAVPERGNAMMGVEVPREQVSAYGVLEMTENNEFIRIVEKPSAEEAPSNLINVATYVLNYDTLQMIKDYTAETREGEYQITDPINDAVQAGITMKVVPAVGEFLDGGNLQGWLHANQVVIQSQ